MRNMVCLKCLFFFAHVNLQTLKSKTPGTEALKTSQIDREIYRQIEIGFVTSSSSFLGWYLLFDASYHKSSNVSYHPGSVVRVGPNELSFIDEDAWTGIYSKPPGKPQLRKDDYVIRPIRKDVKGLLFETNDTMHGRMRYVIKCPQLASFECSILLSRWPTDWQDYTDATFPMPSRISRWENRHQSSLVMLTCLFGGCMRVPHLRLISRVGWASPCLISLEIWYLASRLIACRLRICM